MRSFFLATIILLTFSSQAFSKAPTKKGPSTQASQYRDTSDFYVGDIHLFRSQAGLRKCGNGNPTLDDIEGPIIGVSDGSFCFIAHGAIKDAVLSILLAAKALNKKIRIYANYGGSGSGIADFTAEVVNVRIIN